MDLRSPEAQRLQEGVGKKREDYVNAKRKYQAALSIALDTNFSSDGTTGLRIASQEYRRSVESYRIALNRWADHLKRVSAEK
jgi:hypothetical protein